MQEKKHLTLTSNNNDIGISVSASDRALKIERVRDNLTMRVGDRVVDTGEEAPGEGELKGEEEQTPPPFHLDNRSEDVTELRTY